MTKGKFLKCLPDKDDLKDLISDCFDEDNGTTDFEAFQIAISDFVENKIEEGNYGR